MCAHVDHSKIATSDMWQHTQPVVIHLTFCWAIYFFKSFNFFIQLFLFYVSHLNFLFSHLIFISHLTFFQPFFYFVLAIKLFSAI
jgi:hypothetical protein